LLKDDTVVVEVDKTW